MTTRGPNSRRDAKIKGDSLIRGFRMEPDLARRLTDYARKHFTDERDSKAHLARAARYLMRRALGISPPEDGERGSLSVQTRGMVIDKTLRDAVERERGTIELGEVGAIRHVLRVALGVPPHESLKRERRFAMIAEIRRGENV